MRSAGEGDARRSVPRHQSTDASTGSGQVFLCTA
jgi:hypothetical protein